MRVSRPVTISVKKSNLKAYHSCLDGEAIEMWREWRIRFVCIVVVASAALAAPAYSPVKDSAAEPQPPPGVYLPPNEQHPAVALPIYRRSNHGVYVSVGTERSFIGAALSRANALFVIDYDPETIRFANINRALLAASTDRTDYLNLRLNASPDLWQQRSQRLAAENKKTLSNPDSWTFWDKKVRKNQTAWDNAFLHFHTQPKGPGEPFFAANYLFDDRLYSQLSQLAKSSRIWARQLDLRHENEVRSFCEELKSRGLTLGVIDTSDVPNSSETGTSVAAQYVKLISQYAPDDAIFLNTAPGGGHGVHWSYFAFSNRKVRGRDPNTIKRWYEIEMKKISSTDQLQSLLDDPDAINH
jgi:hypothetical protein